MNKLIRDMLIVIPSAIIGGIITYAIGMKKNRTDYDGSIIIDKEGEKIEDIYLQFTEQGKNKIEDGRTTEVKFDIKRY